MIFDGDHSVIAALREKKRLRETSQPHEHIRPLLIQGGGLMRGVYGVGAVLALEERGFTNAFSTMVGISSGAPIVAHFAAGTAKEGVQILLEDCTDPKFVNPWRFWNQVDTNHFMDVVRNDPRKKIDVAKVFANPAEVFFGVAEYKTALPKLIKPHNEEHFFKSMHASINMQNVSSYKVIIDGVQYADGGFSSPHVIGKAIEEVKPTHVLVVTNNDRDFTPIFRKERLLNRTIFRLRLNGVLAQAINSRREARDTAIADAIEGGIPTAVVWGDGSISGMEKNPAKIAATVEASRVWWHGFLSADEN